MNAKKKGRRVAAGLLATVFAALVIGCGGGGGGNNDTSASGLSGLSATATATATATASGATATASGATATATASGSTATATGSGVLPANVVFFSDSPDQANGTFVTDYRYITPSTTNTPGTANTLYVELAATFGAVAFNSVNQTKYFSFQADGNSPYGIYSNTTFSTTGAKSIVAPTYSFVGAIQVSPDGTTLYYLAATGANNPQIFTVPVGGGVAPTALDFAENMQLNAAGNQLVYSKLIGLSPQLFVRGIAPTSTPTRITNNAFQDDQPQWNKAGTQIVYISNPSGNADDIFLVNPDGSGGKQVTNTPNADERSPSFNGAGTSISFVARDIDLNKTGIFTETLGTGTDVNRNLVVQDASVLDGTYWTDAHGRGPKSWSYLVRSKRTASAAAAKIVPAPAPTTIKPKK